MRWLFIVTVVALAGCPPTATYPRALCQSVSGTELFNGRQRIISKGMPVPEPEIGTSCVETGHTGAQAGVVYVSADNPRVWTNVQLGSAPIRHQGDAHQIVQSTTEGWAGTNCDFDVRVGGGDGAATSHLANFADNVSGSRRALTDDLLPWTVNPPANFGGSDPTSLTWTLDGLRVGLTPINTQLFVTNPNFSRTIDAFPISNIVLDPSVLLVPVQVFVLSSDAHPVNINLQQQLELWDRVPNSTTVNETVPPGDLTVAQHTISNWLFGAENGPGTARVGNWFVPDDVWIPCGIQYRLVNFTFVATEDSVAWPPDHGQDLQGQLSDTFTNVIAKHPNFIKGVPVMIFTPLCTPFGVAQQGQLSMPAGISLVSQAVACVSVSQSSASNADVPAHEMGHVVLQSPDHVDCTIAANQNNLMCPAAGGPLVNATQCAAARTAVSGSSWMTFFH